MSLKELNFHVMVSTNKPSWEQPVAMQIVPVT